jgi:hypothetical protein
MNNPFDETYKYLWDGIRHFLDCNRNFTRSIRQQVAPLHDERFTYSRIASSAENFPKSLADSEIDVKTAGSDLIAGGTNWHNCPFPAK